MLSLMALSYMYIYVHWAMRECRISLILPHFPACGLSSGCAKGELGNDLISYIVELNFIRMEPLFFLSLIAACLVKFLRSL